MKMTKVKNRPGQLSPISDGKSYKGKFDREPKVGESAWFSGDRIHDWIITSEVVNISTETEPGKVFLETLNSIYVVELDSDEKLW